MSQSAQDEQIPVGLAEAFKRNPVERDMAQFVATYCFCGQEDCDMISMVIRNPTLKPLAGTEEILCTMKFSKSDIPELIQNLRELL